MSVSGFYRLNLYLGKGLKMSFGSVLYLLIVHFLHLKLLYQYGFEIANFQFNWADLGFFLMTKPFFPYWTQL